jgi:hypothetical protein
MYSFEEFEEFERFEILPLTPKGEQKLQLNGNLYLT